MTQLRSGGAGLRLKSPIRDHVATDEQERNKEKLSQFRMMVGNGGETEYIPDAKITQGDGRKVSSGI